MTEFPINRAIFFGLTLEMVLLFLSSLEITVLTYQQCQYSGFLKGKTKTLTKLKLCGTKSWKC